MLTLQYAYVTNFGSSSLQIIDITNKASPTIVSTTLTGTSPQGIYVQNSFAYIACVGSQTIEIYNIGNPFRVSLLGLATLSDQPGYLFVQDVNVYITEPGVFRSLNAINPITIPISNNGASATAAGPANLVFVMGRFAYVLAGSSLYIFDLGGAYIQQLQGGGTEFGTLQVLSNAVVGNDLNVLGAISTNYLLNSGGAGIGSLILGDPFTVGYIPTPIDYNEDFSYTQSWNGPSGTTTATVGISRIGKKVVLMLAPVLQVSTTVSHITSTIQSIPLRFVNQNMVFMVIVEDANASPVSFPTYGMLNVSASGSMTITVVGLINTIQSFIGNGVVSVGWSVPIMVAYSLL